MPDVSPEDRIQAFRRKIARVLFARSALAWLTLWALGYGTVVLAARIGLGTPVRTLVWGLATAVPFLLAAAIAARRRISSAGATRALLDRESGCGGLLMADAEIPLGAWKGRIAPVRLPRVAWRARRPWALGAGAALFLFVAFAGPWRLGARENALPLQVGSAIERLEAQVETLAQEKLLTEERADALQERLQQVAAEADGRDPARTWETLDHLEETVANTAREAGEAAVADTHQLRKAEEVARAISQSAASLGSADMAGSLEELAGLLENPAVAASVGSAAAERLRSGKAGVKDLERLASRIHLSKAEIAERMSRLHSRRLIDGKALGECRSAGQCDGSRLAAFLAENATERKLADRLQSWSRGGIDRGRGDAPLAFTDPASEQGARFKEQVLPPGALGTMDQSTLLAVSKSAPEEAKRGKPSAGGALAGSPASGGSALTYTVLPRHRGAVKRFFERR